MGKTVNVPSGKYVLHSARVKVDRGFVHLLGVEESSSIEILNPRQEGESYRIQWVTANGKEGSGLLIPIN